MDRHNGLVIAVVFVIVLAALGAAYSLAVHGRDYAAFLTVATSALAALTPSALKQAPRASVSAESVGSVAVGSESSDGKS